MRRKRTDPPKLDAEELPDLTAQQMKFVEQLLAGKTAADAYRSAYDCSQTSAASVWALASRLRADVKVSSWLSAARKAHLGHSKVTLDQHVQRLDELKQIAIETGNVGAAVQAEQLIGKAIGHYIDQFRDLTPNDPDAILDQIRQMLPGFDAEKLLPN